MPTPIVVGDICLAQINCHINNQVGLPGCHFRALSKVGTGANWEDAASQMDAVLGPLTQPLLANTAVYRWMQLIPILPVRLSTFADGTSTGNGTAGATALPTQTCGIVTKLTGFAGRAFRGRMYMPFPSETDNATAGQPDITYVGHLNALCAAFLAPWTITGAGGSIDLLPTILHKNGTNTLMTGFRVNAKWATQRRRGAYGQSNP